MVILWLDKQEARVTETKGVHSTVSEYKKTPTITLIPLEDQQRIKGSKWWIVSCKSHHC